MATSTTATSGGNAIANDFTLSPEMTDCDSADLESEMSINEGSYHSSGPRMHTSMPVLEDGLSSGHASDLEDDVIYSRYSQPFFEIFHFDNFHWPKLVFSNMRTTKCILRPAHISNTDEIRT